MKNRSKSIQILKRDVFLAVKHGGVYIGWTEEESITGDENETDSVELKNHKALAVYLQNERVSD